MEDKNLDAAQQWAVDNELVKDQDWKGPISKHTIVWILYSMFQRLMGKYEKKYMAERTIILDALIRVTVLLFTAVIISILKGWIDRNRDNRELQIVLQMAHIAVKSVENDLRTEDGHKKKTEAIARLAGQINAWGLKGFGGEELSRYIDTAVKEKWNQELTEPLLIEDMAIQERLSDLTLGNQNK